MKLVAWNCQDDFARKFSALAALGPDVAIVCEARRGALAQLSAEVNHIWVGQEGGRGLAVLGFKGWRVAAGEPLLGNWFLPFDASSEHGEFSGVGVWTETGAQPYQVTAINAVQRLAQSGMRPSVVAGDFNLSESPDPRRLVNARVAGVSETLGKCGLRSAWHSVTGEQFGEESAPTYFQHRRAALTLHLDYAFVASSWLQWLEAVSIGRFEDWPAAGLSDHAPVVLDIGDDVLDR